MKYLRQSTASQTRTIGPFVDSTDFVTLENGLTIANTDILLKKNGAASAAKNSGGATADGSGGMYAVTFDATDSATVGEVFYSVKVAGALVVFGSFTVLEEAVYDALFAASAPGYGTAQTGDSYALIGANGAGLTDLATQASVDVIDGIVDDIKAVTVKLDTALEADGAAGYQFTTLALENGPAGGGGGDATAANQTTIISALGVIDDFLDTEIAAIKAKTDLIPAAPAAAGDIPTGDEIADAILARNVSGGSSTGRTVKQALHFLRNKWTVAAGTLTVYDTDDTTSSWTAAVSSSASAEPITGNDPA